MFQPLAATLAVTPPLPSPKTYPTPPSTPQKPGSLSLDSVVSPVSNELPEAAAEVYFPPKLDIKQRKKLVLFGTSPKTTNSLNRLVKLRLRRAITREEEEDPKNKDSCWIYREPTQSQCRARRILVRVSLDKNNAWQPHFGIASLLVNKKLTAEQKDGIIRDNWELSHLCGNWRCMNHQHYTLELKSTNISRNRCFRDGVCIGHKPPCIIQPTESKIEDLTQIAATTNAQEIKCPVKGCT